MTIPKGKHQVKPAGPAYDAVVVGAGPNGLAAGLHLAREGCRTIIFEAAAEAGGGCRTAELVLPGFVHDVCSSIHPLAVASPFFRSLDLKSAGLEWVHPDALLAHPLDDDRAVILHRSLSGTADALENDGDSYYRLLRPFVEKAESLFEDVLAPLHIPDHPLLLASFGIKGLRSATALARGRFKSARARAMFGGLAAHSFLPLNRIATSAFGLILAVAGHTVGWPFPKGGSQNIIRALETIFTQQGGEIVVNHEVTSIDELPSSQVVLLDLTPRQILRIAGHRLPRTYSARLRRYRYGAAAFKIDWALNGPIPWKDPECRRAGTLHLGGTIEQMASTEKMVGKGIAPVKPFVLIAQHSIFDSSRAPSGRQTAWAYCHVPNRCAVDMTERIEAQVERFAPGFRDVIEGRHVMGPAELEHYNANYVGGDVNGGIQDIRQLFNRPMLRRVPYSTPQKGLYICSSSTPPGGGVHGMCGFHAACAAMRDL